MSFLAVELPRTLKQKESVDAESWMQTFFNEDSTNTFLVMVNRREDARKLAFDEIYKDVSMKEAMKIAQHEIKELSAGDNAEYIMRQYVRFDRQIILNIIDDIRIREQSVAEIMDVSKIDDRVYELSVETVKQLCYESSAFRIGLVEVKKELSNTKDRLEEREEYNPFASNL